MLKKFRFFIILGVIVLVFLPGFAKLQELRQKLDSLQGGIVETQQRNAALEEKIAQMKNSPEYLELVAREKMGVVRKGETVIKIVEEDKTARP